MVRKGEFARSSREPNRRIVVAMDSLSLRISQPKLLAGLLSQDCTSPTSPAVEVKEKAPEPFSARDALAVATKSPPAVVQGEPLEPCLLFHVAAPAPAGEPP